MTAGPSRLAVSDFESRLGAGLVRQTRDRASTAPSRSPHQGSPKRPRRGYVAQALVASAHPRLSAADPHMRRIGRASQAYTLWRLTPYRPATSVTGTPASTSSTARYLCSVTLNSHSMSGVSSIKRSSCVKHQAGQHTVVSTELLQLSLRLQGRTFGAPGPTALSREQRGRARAAEGMSGQGDPP